MILSIEIIISVNLKQIFGRLFVLDNVQVFIDRFHVVFYFNDNNKYFNLI